MAARILLVDDHALVRQGFRANLSGLPEEFDVVGEAGDGASALDVLRALAPDLAIIDLDLGSPVSGLDILLELRRRGSHATTLICSMTTAPHVVANAFLAGADGYLFKSAPPEEALRAVRKVLSRERYLPLPVPVLRAASARFEARATRDDEHEAALSTRESELLRNLRRGLSSREAAALMHVREKTVERHRSSIRRKLQLSEAEFKRLLGHG